MVMAIGFLLDFLPPIKTWTQDPSLLALGHNFQTFNLLIHYKTFKTNMQIVLLAWVFILCWEGVYFDASIN